MRKIKRVVLHCAATQDYPEDNKAFDAIGAADIRVWHMKDNGWSDIAYHIVIRRTGVIESGRPPEVIGAHVSGHNRDTLGVCWIGTRLPTDKQVESLADVYLAIRKDYGLCYDAWFGHYELDNRKICPGIPMSLVRGYLRYIDDHYE